MRELKYRVVDEKHNKVYSNEEVDDDGGIIVTISDGKLIAFEISMAGDYRDLKLIEYTGLKDKNSVEIYEGDIVDYGAFDLSVIKYEDGTYWARLGQYPLNVVHRDIEVKGNIYENPELLSN